MCSAAPVSCRGCGEGCPPLCSRRDACQDRHSSQAVNCGWLCFCFMRLHLGKQGSATCSCRDQDSCNNDPAATMHCRTTACLLCMHMLLSSKLPHLCSLRVLIIACQSRIWGSYRYPPLTSIALHCQRPAPATSHHEHRGLAAQDSDLRSTDKAIHMPCEFNINSLRNSQNQFRCQFNRAAYCSQTVHAE